MVEFVVRGAMHLQGQNVINAKSGQPKIETSTFFTYQQQWCTTQFTVCYESTLHAEFLRYSYLV